jgi:hypothetical protein
MPGQKCVKTVVFFVYFKFLKKIVNPLPLACASKTPVWGLKTVSHCGLAPRCGC